MAKLLIQSVRNYHSNLWPHARAGDTMWGDSNTLRKLERDTGPGWWKILKIEDDRGVINVEKISHEPDHSDGAEAAPAKAPPKKRGRPKKAAG